MNNTKFMKQIKERLQEVGTLAAGGASVQAVVTQVQSDIQAELQRAEKLLAERHTAHALEHQRRVAEARARVEAAKKAAESVKISVREVVVKRKLELKMQKVKSAAPSAPTTGKPVAAEPLNRGTWSSFLDDSKFNLAESSPPPAESAPSADSTPPKPDPDHLSWSKFIHE